MNRFLRSFFLLALFLSGNTVIRAQGLADSAFSAGLFFANYSFQFPGGDLVNRFGPNSDIGGGFLYKTSKNWLVGFQGSYLFGNDVKEDNIFRNISTTEGYLIDQVGTFAEVYLYERGFHLSANLGKVIPLGRPNPNSGLMLMAGAGYLQHKIRIENPNNGAAQVKGDYKKGYDRLTGGFCANQFVGYMFFSNSKIFNFYGGLEFKEAWTKSLREYDFDNRSRDTRQRLDLLWGFKIGWVLPFYRKTGTVFYYY
ncbi:MAG: hypothetical protein NTU44_18175 [Bacteroidetes bacterium]|nr:hypothetical protein [Bacteroidota bacterium]